MWFVNASRGKNTEPPRGILGFERGGGKSYELIGLKQPEIGLLVHVTWEDLLSL